MIQFRDSSTLLLMKVSLEQKLNEGAIKGELVDVSGLRQIGKSTALVAFSKRFDLPIIVGNSSSKDYLIKGLGGSQDLIFSFDDIREGNLKAKRVLVDEGVNLSFVKVAGLEIVTGFCNQY